jgi:hypothetical protein
MRIFISCHLRRIKIIRLFFFVIAKLKAMHHLPQYIPLVFILTIILALYFFYRSIAGLIPVMRIIFVWLLFQGILALGGFYLVDQPTVPRFLFLILPPVAGIVLFFSLQKIRLYIGHVDLKWLTLIHTLRVPVEMVLFWLYIHKTLPQIMTFEGRNPDILVGLTAPFIYYFGFIKNRLPLRTILIWNLVSLGLLLNIAVIAILSMPLSIQQFGFDRPDIALFYFPFVWLPGFMVPLVIFAHLVSIRGILIGKTVSPAFNSSTPIKK